MLPRGERVLTWVDRDIRAIEADLNAKPAIVFRFCGPFHFSGAFHPEGRGLSGREALDLVKLVERQPLPGGPTGHRA